MTVLYYEIKEMLKKQIVLHKRGIALYTRTNSRSHSLIGLSWNGRSNLYFSNRGHYSEPASVVLTGALGQGSIHPGTFNNLCKNRFIYNLSSCRLVSL